MYKKRKNAPKHRKPLNYKTSVLFVTKSGIYLRKPMKSEQQTCSKNVKRKSMTQTKYSLNVCDVELHNCQRF